MRIDPFNGNGSLAAMESIESLPGVSTVRPMHPEYAVETRRLQSFSTWPLWALQSPESLAKAGFYYAGTLAGSRFVALSCCRGDNISPCLVIN